MSASCETWQALIQDTPDGPKIRHLALDRCDLIDYALVQHESRHALKYPNRRRAAWRIIRKRYSLRLEAVEVPVPERKGAA
ncbi:MAG: hypothetical protein AAF604_04465 [Acidobacteriota bacterium]